MIDQPLFKNKVLARSLLYGLALLLLVGGFRWRQQEREKAETPLDIDMSWRDLEYESEEAFQYFRDYLRIDTSPAGGELAGAEFLAGVLEAAGIPVHLERLGERRANLWAILEGEDPQALVLHNHIDVDPINYPEEWQQRWGVDPFDGEVKLPWIFGRGAFDMKSVTIAQLMTMLELKRSGERLKRSLIFLATSDEETGSWLGTRWILKQHPELVSRFAAVLTEGGAVEATQPDQVTYWGTEFGQKRYVEVRVCHSSRRALDALARDLEQRPETEIPLRLSPPVVEFLRRYAPSRRSKHQQRLLANSALLQDTAFPNEPPFSIPGYLHATLRNEVHAIEMVEEGGSWTLRLLLHLLPGVSLEEGMAEVLPDWMLHGLDYTVQVPHEDLQPSPLDHWVMQGIERVIGGRPEVEDHGPLFLAWVATDARFFREAGIPAYGFSPFLILSVDTHQMTGPGERMVLSAFLDGVDVYVDLVRDLVTH